jgi:hypothetical protein
LCDKNNVLKFFKSLNVSLCISFSLLQLKSITVKFFKFLNVSLCMYSKRFNDNDISFKYKRP